MRLTRTGMAVATMSALALLGGAGCSSMHVRTRAMEGVELAELREWRWLDETSPGAPASRLASRAVEVAVEGSLAAKGYRKVSEDPDFLVTYIVIMEDGLDISPIYTDRRVGYLSIRTETRPYRRGTLLLAVVDAGTRQVVWEGAASDVITEPTPERERERIEEAVSKILGRFPSGDG